MRKILMAAFAAAMAIGFAASPAHAQLDQTWVASNGANANPCSVSQPCADFATAISRTNASGKISCLTSGQYGGFSINKAITVDCQGVDALANAGIYITVPGGTRIVLRGLHITDPSNAAIVIYQGGIVDVEDCLIDGSLIGIAAFSTNATEIRMTNTSILNSAGNGIFIDPRGGPIVTAVINRSKSSGNNLNGIRLIGDSGATTRLQIIDSILTDNANNGVEVGTGAQPVTVMVTSSLISSNANIGVHSGGSAAAVILNGTTITNNPTALSADSGGAIFSYGNNAVNDNGSPGIAPTPVALR